VNVSFYVIEYLDLHLFLNFFTFFLVIANNFIYLYKWLSIYLIKYLYKLYIYIYIYIYIYVKKSCITSIFLKKRIYNQRSARAKCKVFAILVVKGRRG